MVVGFIIGLRVVGSPQSGLSDYRKNRYFHSIILCCAEQGRGPQQAHLPQEGSYADIASAMASAIARRQCCSGNISPDRPRR